MTDTEFNAVVHFILRPIRKHVPDPAYRETFERLSRALNMPFTRMDYAEMMRRGLVSLFEPHLLHVPVHISELRPDVPKLTERKGNKYIEQLKQKLLPPPKFKTAFGGEFSEDEIKTAMAATDTTAKSAKRARRKVKKAVKSLRKAR